MAEWAGGQLRGKVVVGVAIGAAAGAVIGAATAIKAAVIIEAAVATKDKKGDIWDEEALDALFNKIIQYLIINSYVSTITELYI